MTKFSQLHPWKRMYLFGNLSGDWYHIAPLHIQWKFESKWVAPLNQVYLSYLYPHIPMPWYCFKKVLWENHWSNKTVMKIYINTQNHESIIIFHCFCFLTGLSLTLFGYGWGNTFLPLFFFIADSLRPLVLCLFCLGFSKLELILFSFDEAMSTMPMHASHSFGINLCLSRAGTTGPMERWPHCRHTVMVWMG